MYGGPPDSMNMPMGMPFVTKLKTKILLRMDYVLQCKDDESALNGWRLLCDDGIALVRLAIENGELDKLHNPDLWKDLAEKILLAWPPKTFEKTKVSRTGYGYQGEYDHYMVEVNREDLAFGLRSLEKEKYNVINSKLMEIWGDCYSIAMAVKYLDLEEQIEIPVNRDYGDRDITDGVSGRMLRRKTSQQSEPTLPR